MHLNEIFNSQKTSTVAKLQLEFNESYILEIFQRPEPRTEVLSSPWNGDSLRICHSIQHFDFFFITVPQNDMIGIFDFRCLP